MAAPKRNRIIVERALREPAAAAVRRRPVRSVSVNLAESPLGWLAARGLIDARQLAAGERLRADWERAQLSPSVTMRWHAPPIGKVARSAPEGVDPTVAQIAAKRRFEKACAELGPGLVDIAWRIICAGEGMREAETALGWPARAGRLVLGLALDRLAGHYRLV